MKNPFSTIKIKLLIVLLAFGLIPFIIISIVSIRTIKSELQDEIFNKLILFADAKTDQLFSYFDLIEGRTVDFAHDRFIWMSSESILKEASEDKLKELNDYLINDKLPLDNALLGIAILDLNGHVMASTYPQQINTDQSKADFFKQGLKGSFIIDFEDESITKEKKAFLVSAPIRTKDGMETLGVLINVFDSKKLETGLFGQLGFTQEGDYLLSGTALETLEIYIVNSHKEIFVDLHSMNKKPYDRSAVMVDTLPVRKCLNNVEPLGGVIYDNYRGEEVIGVSVCFPEKDWVILSEITMREAFLPLKQVYIKLGFFISIFFLTVLLFALVLSRKVTDPIHKMMNTIEQVRGGNLGARVKVYSKDEIGKLAQTFNEMAEKLKKSHVSLEKKVNEKTGELNEKVIKIRQEKAKDEAMLASIGDGIIMTDQYGKIALINRAAQEILSWDQQKMLGKDLSNLLRLEDSGGRLLPKNERPISIALSHLKKAGGTYFYAPSGRPRFPITITITPVILNQNIIGAIMVFRDVTKEKEVERMKTEFVSLVSHQLRTPLSGMKWFTEMLLVGDAGVINEEQKEFINNISELNQRMIDLVNALLNIARIESGRIIIEPQPTHLGTLIEEVMKPLQAKCQAKDLNLVLSVNENLPTVKIDPKLIREVYSNLLSNAIKYTPHGGEIIVFISENDEEIITQITDSGYGIPEHEQEKVFQKFYRGGNIVSIETDGNGLGLYLVKAIIDSSGGKIWFRSKEGDGTTFWFSLPRKGSRAQKGEVSINA